MNLKKWFAPVKRFLLSWYTPAILILLVIAGVLYWAWPRRVETIVSADSDLKWEATEAPPRRQVLWEPSKVFPDLEDLIQEKKKGSFVAPRLTDGGATLYFTFRVGKEDTNIYRSWLNMGKWQPAAIVAELNTPSDEICSSFSKDGQTMFLYSNRPGGVGGFDLYVSRRQGDGWTQPKNMGKPVNSSVDEYDPAISPDGKSLYFSSNRILTVVDEEEDWAGTSRVKPGAPHFDLFVAKRKSAEKKWNTPQPLKDLNLATANEWSPFVSPSGTFLFFVSDRPVRSGEAPNKDIYRARLENGNFVDLENLGEGINSPFEETEPALSPEGFTLFYSSNRANNKAAKQYVFYRSKAQEVYSDVDWDETRWALVRSLWWKILALVLGLALVIAILVYYWKWLFQKATAARFLVASLLLHLIIVIILGIVPLAHTIIKAFEDVEVDSVAENLTKDPTVKPTWEQLTEPQPVQETEQLQVARVSHNLPDAPEKNTKSAVDIRMKINRLEVEPVQEPIPPQPKSQSNSNPLKKLAFRKRVKLNIAEIKQEQMDLPAEQTKSNRLEEVTQENVSPPKQEPAPNPNPTKEKSGPPTTFEEKKVQTTDLRPLPFAPPTKLSPSKLPNKLNKRDPSRIVPPAPTAEKNVPKLTASKKLQKKLQVTGSKIPIEREDNLESFLDSIAKEQRKFSMKTKLPDGKGKNSDIQAKSDNLPEVAARKKVLPGKSTFMKKPSIVGLKNQDVKLDQLVKNSSPAKLPALEGESIEPGKEKSVPMANPILEKENDQANIKPLIPFEESEFKKKLSAPNPDVEASTAFHLDKKKGKAIKIAGAEPKMIARISFLRDPENKKKARKLFGGTDKTEKAVEQGLLWLAAHQNEDGSWDFREFHQNSFLWCVCSDDGVGNERSQTAATGMALLPFLGAGYTHQKGKHKETVQKGLDWLISHQRMDSGDLNPRVFGNSQMYGHGLASIALCEAYGMTKDKKLLSPAKRAIGFIVRAQDSQRGGWRYRPNSGSDTSVVGWQVMALKSAQLAGLDVPEKTLKDARKYLLSVESSKNSGRFGYTNRSPKTPMTAQGLLCLLLIGADKKDEERLRRGGDYLLKNLPQRHDRSTSYYWYHATQVMFHLQGKYWEAWNKRMREVLLNRKKTGGNIYYQRTYGAEAGSWDDHDQYENHGGRIMATSLRLLMLEVYYRHLPLYHLDSKK